MTPMARKRSWLVCVLVVPMGCSGRAPGDAPAATDAGPAAEPAEPFDFWRPIVEPGVYTGSEQVCVATTARRLSASDRQRFVRADVAERDGRFVTCVRPTVPPRRANLVVVAPPGADASGVTVPPYDPEGPRTETRIEVRILGLDARGETVNGELVGVETVELAPSPEDLNPEPCRPEIASAEPTPAPPPPPHPGFDFSTWVDHIGTRQLCVVAYEHGPQLISEEHPPVLNTPGEVQNIMYAGCESAGGTKHLRLLFTPSVATLALTVRPTAFIEGTIDGSGDLWVQSVRPMPRDLSQAAEEPPCP